MLKNNGRLCVLMLLILPLHMVFRVNFLLNGKEEEREWMTNNDQCLSGQERMKVDTFIVVIDEVIQQMQSRFSEQNVAFMKHMSFFTPCSWS